MSVQPNSHMCQAVVIPGNAEELDDLNIPSHLDGFSFHHCASTPCLAPDCPSPGSAHLPAWRCNATSRPPSSPDCPFPPSADPGTLWIWGLACPDFLPSHRGSCPGASLSPKYELHFQIWPFPLPTQLRTSPLRQPLDLQTWSRDCRERKLEVHMHGSPSLGQFCEDLHHAQQEASTMPSLGIPK